MKNLKHIPIQLLENYPTRTKFSDYIKNNKIFCRDKKHTGWSYWDSEEYRKARHIYDGSVGKNADEVLNKMRQALRRFTGLKIEDAIDRIVEKEDNVRRWQYGTI